MRAKDSLEDDPPIYEEIAPFMHLYKTGFDGQSVLDGFEEDDVPWDFAATGGSAESKRYSLIRDSRTTSLDNYVLSKLIEPGGTASRRLDLGEYVLEGASRTPGQLAGFKVLYQAERAIWHYRGHYDLHQIREMQGWGAIKYGHGGHYALHTDHGRTDPRIVSVLIYLNTVQNGGETDFPYMNATVRPIEGNIVVFPSSFPYAHLAAPVVEPKYSVVTWFLQ